MAQAPVSPPAASSVELEDIQGLVRFAYKHQTEAVFLLLRVKDADAARAWLARAEVSNALSQSPPPETALQIALSSAGLRALGVPEDIIRAFSQEYVVGIAGDPNRSRRLGDSGPNDPQQWRWGSGSAVPHAAVLLYALPGKLDELAHRTEASLAAGFEVTTRLATSDMGGVEPFGFIDGISQPALDWKRERPVEDATHLTYAHVSCLGEYLLGYPNEYGLYTARPLLDPSRDPLGALPRAEDAPAKADLGRNGSYLVIRQLRQDVPAFWQTLDRYADGAPAVREELASALIGRRLNGTPMVRGASNAPPPAASADDLNAFDYRSDAHGNRCPLAAHIRRANPRNADLPPGSSGVLGRLERVLGFNPVARSADLVASTRFHRLLRRGREYGIKMSPAQALTARQDSDERGLQFVCLGASLQRQFEFVQSAWLASAKFNGLRDQADPVVGNRLPLEDGTPTGCFSLTQPDGPSHRLLGMPRFVTVLGGAYFFLPGIRALRYLAAIKPAGASWT